MKRSRTIETVVTQPRAAKTTKVVSRRNKSNFPLFKGLAPNKTGFPKQMTMRHKYVQNFSVTGTTGNFTTQALSVNGLFDPDNAGATTSQPMYFDTMKVIYGKYTVMSSKATFTFYPSGVNTNPALVSAFISDTASAVSTTAVGAAEQSTAQFRFIAGGGSNLSQFQQLNQITLRWDAKKNWGGDVVDNDELQGTATANPNEQQFFIIGVQEGIATPAGTSAINVNVVVEYTTVWKELIAQAGQ